MIYHFDSSLQPKHHIKIKEEYYIKNFKEEQSHYSLLGDYLLELRFDAKFQFQMRVVLSPVNRHVDALKYAKLAPLCVKIIILKFIIYISK